MTPILPVAGPCCAAFCAARLQCSSVTCRSCFLATCSEFPSHARTTCNGNSSARSVWQDERNVWNVFGQGSSPARLIVARILVRKFLPESRQRWMTGPEVSWQSSGSIRNRRKRTSIGAGPEPRKANLTRPWMTTMLRFVSVPGRQKGSPQILRMHSSGRKEPRNFRRMKRRKGWTRFWISTGNANHSGPRLGNDPSCDSTARQTSRDPRVTLIDANSYPPPAVPAILWDSRILLPRACRACRDARWMRLDAPTRSVQQRLIPSGGSLTYRCDYRNLPCRTFGGSTNPTGIRAVLLVGLHDTKPWTGHYKSA